jgi:hypothetical protein
VEGSQNVP